jgi:hypothetical protein
VEGSGNSEVGVGGVGSTLGKARCGESEGGKWKVKTKSEGMCEWMCA